MPPCFPVGASKAAAFEIQLAELCHLSPFPNIFFLSSSRMDRTGTSCGFQECIGFSSPSLSSPKAEITQYCTLHIVGEFLGDRDGKRKEPKKVVEDDEGEADARERGRAEGGIDDGTEPRSAKGDPTQNSWPFSSIFLGRTQKETRYVPALSRGLKVSLPASLANTHSSPFRRLDHKDWPLQRALSYDGHLKMWIGKSEQAQRLRSHQLDRRTEMAKENKCH